MELNSRRSVAYVRIDVQMERCSFFGTVESILCKEEQAAKSHRENESIFMQSVIIWTKSIEIDAYFDKTRGQYAKII